MNIEGSSPGRRAGAFFVGHVVCRASVAEGRGFAIIQLKIDLDFSVIYTYPVEYR
jgi:hypothetical protein